MGDQALQYILWNKWSFDFQESVKIITVTVHLEISYEITMDHNTIKWKVFKCEEQDRLRG